MLLIRNGLIFDAVHREPYTADILVKDGKIAEIGAGLTADCPTFDAAGLHIYPGFVEAHCHIGLDGSGIGFEGDDCNEMTDILTPQLRAIDGIYPQDPTFREALMKAQEYDAKKQAAGDDPAKRPPLDVKLEALLPVLHGEVPLKAHAHRADDIFTAIRIAKEFGVRLTLEHVTEGHLIAEDLAKEDYPMAVGPSLTHASKFELRNKTFTTPGILAKAGCRVSIITDSPVIPQSYLPLCAALAVRAGMDPFDALRAITIRPAEHIGAADRVGSIERGKDADFVVMDGPWDAVSSGVKAVFVNGEKVCGAAE